eukprot:TRINITY_DN904_c0_g2_i8.p2 TRINITY_DN904_c0_g2~~TRINITY_DN904_c0_g2_i8.p2  ORF type:complete len:106 (-),score=13.67 TRINITY_DN904_c0_g2_i8:474-791(-)
MLLLEADITERREEDEGAGAYFYDFLTTQSTRKVIDSKFFSNTLKHTNSSNREAQRREKVLLRKRLQEERYGKCIVTKAEKLQAFTLFVKFKVPVKFFLWFPFEN